MNSKNITPLPYLDIVLSIYNQERLIERVLHGIFKNTTTPFTLILVFDGCTDRTEEIATNYLKKHSPLNLKKVVTDYANNVNETRANNIGFKKSTADFMITLQDDVVISELGWERRLTFPLRKFKDVFAVTSRGTHDVMPGDGIFEVYGNRISREYRNHPRNLFAIRDVINRGPIAFNMSCLRKLNYLNDRYAPCNLDDADLCLRAWKEYKWKCGSFWIDYVSKPNWGISHTIPDSISVLNDSIRKHTRFIYQDHAEYINSGVKHDENIIIEDKEIDYSSKDDKQLNYLRDIECYTWNHGQAPAVDHIKFFLEGILVHIDQQFRRNSRTLGIKKAFGKMFGMK